MSGESSSIGAGATSQPSAIIVLDGHQRQVIRDALVMRAQALLGILYDYGAEWTDYSKLPVSLDCSEMTRGIFKTEGLKMPDGSQNQFNFTLPVVKEKALPGDLAFFGKGGDILKVYHVGMIFDLQHIIEARGFDSKASFPTGKVITRPRENWENYCNFLGYRAHPKLA